jgi:hypothetical protein
VAVAVLVIKMVFLVLVVLAVEEIWGMKLVLVMELSILEAAAAVEQVEALIARVLVVLVLLFFGTLPQQLSLLVLDSLAQQQQ